MQKWTENCSIDGVQCRFEFEKDNPQSNNDIYIRVYDSSNILLAEGINEDDVYEDVRDILRTRS